MYRVVLAMNLIACKSVHRRKTMNFYSYTNDLFQRNPTYIRLRHSLNERNCNWKSYDTPPFLHCCPTVTTMSLVQTVTIQWVSFKWSLYNKSCLNSHYTISLVQTVTIQWVSFKWSLYNNSHSNGHYTISLIQMVTIQWVSFKRSLYNNSHSNGHYTISLVQTVTIQ